MRKFVSLIIANALFCNVAISAESKSTKTKAQPKAQSNSTSKTKATDSKTTESKENAKDSNNTESNNTTQDSNNTESSQTTQKSSSVKKKKKPTFKQDGWFIGAYGGISLFNFEFDTSRRLLYDATKSTFNFGVKSGYFQYFNKYVGLRADLAFDYNTNHVLDKTAQGATVGEGYSVNFWTFTTNLDLLVNVYSKEKFTITLFGGLGLGVGYYMYSTLLDNSIDTWKDYILLTTSQIYYVPVRLGVNATIMKHHQAELFVRIPTFGFGESWKGSTPGLALIKPTIISLGYSYIF